MSLLDKTPPSQSDFISFELDLHHAPKKVWRALTTPELLEQWLLPVIELKTEPGAKFRFQAPPKPGWDGRVDCELLEIDPEKSLTMKWLVGELDTLVTFTLTPTEYGTRLLLVQSGFKSTQKQNFAGARYGWNLMGGRLIDLLARDAS